MSIVVSISTNLKKANRLSITTGQVLLNAELMKKFFLSKMQNYCEVVLKLDDCSIYDASSCAMEKPCGENTRCEYVDDTSVVG